MIVDEENVDECAQRADKGQHKATEIEDNERAWSSKAGLFELFCNVRVLQHFLKVEFLGDRADRTLGFALNALLLELCAAGTPQLLALRGYLLQASLKLVALKRRQHDADNGHEHCDRDRHGQ